MVRRFRAPCAAALIAACAVTARADIVSHGIQVHVRPPDITPTSGDTGQDTVLENNEYLADDHIHVWFERTVRINQPMQLDEVTSDFGTRSDPKIFNRVDALTPGTISAGTRLDSYYLLFDSSVRRTRLQDTSGSMSITFDTEILGIALNNSGIFVPSVGLRESDDASGDANGTNQAFQGPGILTYGDFAQRGFELGTRTNEDRFSISADRRTITILNVYADRDSDAIRIFVAGTPEPATLSLFGAGAVGMFWLLLRKRRRAAAAVKIPG